MFLSHSHKIMTNLQLQHSGRIFQRLGTSSVSKVLAVQMQGCKQTKLSVTIHDYNPSTGETETDRSLPIYKMNSSSERDLVSKTQTEYLKNDTQGCPVHKYICVT